MKARTPLDYLIRACLQHRLIVGLVSVAAIVAGILVAPFDWDAGPLPRHPVPVDAIPDIGENQQIVFTDWPGRSPQDVEDQITYPLTSAMLGLPEVKSVRSYSMFGFSTVYVIFAEGVDFYWSRSRILEKLASLPAGTLPAGAKPQLGPDATALGQVFWYTLEGRDPEGRPAGGWDLQELRSIQDYQVRYALLSAPDIAEVASVGGHVKEYQIDVDPDALRAYGITLDQVYDAVRRSNLDVGARTIEINRVEYVVRGLGFLQNLDDLRHTVIVARQGTPVYVDNVVTVAAGPALRRGALDKGGTEAVGGVAVVRHGANPLAAIKGLKSEIAELAPGLPAKAIVDYDLVNPEQLREFAAARGFAAFTEGRLNQDGWLAWQHRTPRAEWPTWLNRSQVTVVPFYDRTGLIHETLGTLETALSHEILVTLIVILVMVLHLRSSLLIGATLPLAVLLCFLAMKAFGVDANIVALSGIAIAIGTIVDMGIIVCENILKHLDAAAPEADRQAVIYRATSEVGGAVLTAILTTIVSFLPVFFMIGAEGKLFRPLAFTKTFALLASVVLALTVLPPLAQLLFRRRRRNPGRWRRWLHLAGNLLLALLVGVLLARHWLPLGPGAGFWPNLLATVAPIALLLGGFALFQRIYEPVLRWFLAHKLVFAALPLLMLGWGLLAWLGAGRLLPAAWHDNPLATRAIDVFPGLGTEFMPNLDEGSFLYMPTTMPHASIGEALDVLQQQDRAFHAIPEVAEAVGKIGRADTALDPAPVSMIETVISYHPEFLEVRPGHRQRYRFAPATPDLFRNPAGDPVPAPDGQPYQVPGTYARDPEGKLIPDPTGRPFRLWRPPLDPALNPGREAWPGIRSPADIWDAIVAAGRIPGTTSAPMLQPIAARLVMLQSGMRAPMGIKVKGPDLETVEAFGLELEQLLQEVPGVKAEAVLADRIVGKPYLEIAIDRRAAARYGVPIQRVQDVLEIAVGGRPITTTVEGRERYPVRVRYQRERRDSLEALREVLVAGHDGTQVPLAQLAEIRYTRGPQVIKSEDTALVGYVLFDKLPGYAEIDVVEAADDYLRQEVAAGRLRVPPGVSWSFAGNYQNQQRAMARFAIILPLALLLIVIILHLQFRSLATTALVFSGIVVAWAGGFILLWGYGQPWFLDISLFGENLRDVCGVQPVNLSVAVWVGFLALFGIATDDGVVMATYLSQSFADNAPGDRAGVRDAVVQGATRRLRPCLMTSATTILALLPVLTSTGRGADIMVPMAIPSFGGMLFVLVTLFVVPVGYCALRELRLRR